MNILYIADFLYFTDGGAHVSALAHRKTLTVLYGKDCVDVISLTGQRDETPKFEEIELVGGEKNKIKLFIECINGYTTYLNKKGIETIIRKIGNKEYDLIFIDNSIFGKLVKRIKEVYPQMPVITYYHDVKASLAADWMRKAPIYKKCVYRAMITSERMNQIYSDVNLTLNPREDALYKKAYGKNPEMRLGVYMDVPLHTNYISANDKMSVPLQLLFVGSHYLPNVQGITWFIEKVIPDIRIPVTLTIAGSHMEELKQELAEIPENINILGHVDDLTGLYEAADVVISPIFEGGGMKVKVTHAAAYGKVIIGTDESYEGYQENIKDNQWNELFYRCNNKEEFMKAIELIRNNVNLRKFNIEIRNYFEEYYSEEYARKTIEKAVKMAFVKVKG